MLHSVNSDSSAPLRNVRTFGLGTELAAHVRHAGAAVSVTHSVSLSTRVCSPSSNV